MNKEFFNNKFVNKWGHDNIKINFNNNKINLKNNNINSCNSCNLNNNINNNINLNMNGGALNNDDQKAYLKYLKYKNKYLQLCNKNKLE